MKYLEDGRVVELVAVLPDDRGCVVDPYWEDSETGEPYLSGDLEIVDTVFDQSPVPAYADEIQKQKEILKSHTEQLHKVRAEIREATEERRRILDKLKQVPALKRMEDFVEGRITHLVFKSSGKVDILPYEEKSFEPELDPWMRKERRKRLLLIGQDDGSLSFCINNYSDGSGYNVDAFPCTSEAEAVAIATEMIQTQLTEPVSNYELRNAVESAVKLDIPVAQKFLDALHLVRVEQARSEVQYARRKHEEAQQQYEEANGKLIGIERGGVK